MNVPPPPPGPNQQPPLPPPPPPSEYEGLGGWLVLVALGLIIAPLRLGYTLVTVFLPLFAKDKWEMFTVPGARLYHPLMGPLIIGEVAGNLLTALMALVLLVLFFSRKSFFPVLMIVYLGGSAVFVTADLVVSNMIPYIAEQQNPQAMQELVRAGAGCLIWIPYMLVSKRVKATFTW